MVHKGSPSGIIWMGPVGDLGGYGNVSRNFIKTFWHLQLPVHVVNIGGVDPEMDLNIWRLIVQKQSPLQALGDHPFLFIHGEPTRFHDTPTLPIPFAKKIGVTIFETDRIPSHWIQPCNDDVDELWVPSAFNLDTFSNSGVSIHRIKKIPYPFDASEFLHENNEYQPMNVNLLPSEVKKFKFLYTCAFDFRKGLDLLIHSYCSTFTNNDDVTLVLKVYVPKWNENIDVVSYIRSLIPKQENPPHIFLILNKMNRQDLISLFRSVDCYISTDRANGWGMPCMEMMALGKPTITIDWSGSTEFMKEHNAFLIHPESELEPVHPLLQQYRPHEYLDHRWAKVSSREVSSVLRTAYEHTELRDQKAREGQKTILEEFSIQKIAHIISQTWS